MSKRFGPLLAALGVLAAGPALAQWTTQTLSLDPGWSAVQLRVQPEADECGVIFSNTAVEAVYWWRREGTTEEFDVDPDAVYPRSASWEYWFATNAAASTFERLLAGETYQIRVSSNASPQVVALKGRALLNPIYWVPDELNLVGLSVPAGEVTTFGQFFYFTSEFAVNATTATVFRVGADSSPERIFQPWTAGVRAGEAYWVEAGPEPGNYDGPLHVYTDTGARLLDFGSSITPRYLYVQNQTTTGRVVRIEQVASETPPDGTKPLLGWPSLLYSIGDTAGQPYGQMPLVLTTNIPGSSVLALKLAPDVASLTGGVAGSSWQGVLEISDADNTEFADATVFARVGVSCNGEVSGLSVPTGLWVGDVTVTHVSRAPARSMVESSWDSTEVQPVLEPYSFRVIFHVDGAGETKLLQRVLVAWRPDGEVISTPIGSYTNGAVDLLSDEALAETFVLAHPGATISRISSTTFPLMDPVVLSGMFGGDDTLAGVVELPFDDAVNPFVHRYHPQHDNLEYRNGQAFALGEGKESYTVTRSLWFDFTSTDPDNGVANRQWGISEAGGDFRETVDGLNKTIYAQGSFRVRKLSDIAVVE